MCLVVLGLLQSDEYPLIFAGNRDEFYARPTAVAAWWPDKPDIVGGRDQRAGGTWLALHRKGRFATVTNFRDAEAGIAGLRSRGHLVTEFLESTASPLDYLMTIDGARYAGFNLIVGDAGSVAYLSNRGDTARLLPPGIYGLSNELLDSPWDKVQRSKRELAALVDRDAVDDATLLRLLADRRPGPLDEVDSAELGFELAHAITAPFIVADNYGTRCSTTVLADSSGNWRMTERRFDANGVASGETCIDFSAST